MATDSFDKRLGNKIRQLRIMSGMSQQNVADLLGVTFQQVQKYEQGANRITAKTLYILSKHLHVPLTEILEGVPEYTPSSEASEAQVEMIRSCDSLHQKQVSIVQTIISAFICVNNQEKRV